MTKRLILSATYSAVIAALAVPLTAYSQEQTEKVEKIEIIEHRLPFRGNVAIETLPQAVTILSDEMFDDWGITSFQSAMDTVTSSSRQNNFGGLWESFAIRGFAGDENLPSAYLINGFSAGRGYSGLRDLSNIAAIEVVKGPGSALYGRSEPGGTVNIITKKPLFERQGYLQLTGGRYNFKRLEGDYTNALSDDIALRINGAFEQSDSYRDTIETQKQALTPSIVWRISEDTTLTYELEFNRQEIPFDRGIPVLAGLDLPSSRFLGEPGDGPMEVEANGHQVSMAHQINEDWSMLVGLGLRDSSLEGFSSDTELSPGRQLLYTDGQTLNRQRRYRDYDAEDASARMEFSGEFNSAGMNHNLLFGADFYDYELHTKQQRYRVGWGSGDTSYSINVFDPIYGQALPQVAPTSDIIEQQEAWGLYFQDLIELSNNLNVLVGLRYDRFEQALNNIMNETNTEYSESALNPRFGIVYEVSPGIKTYASYSEGFRPNTGADHQGNTFEPEKSQSLETGIKWQLMDNALSGNVALFKAEKSNILTSDPVNSGFSAALGEAQSSGLEFEISYMLTDSTTLSGSYTYVDAHTVNDMVNLDWGVDIPAGSQLINIPKHNYHLALYQHTEISGKSVDFGINVHHVGQRLGETINPDYKLPSYTLTNVFAQVELNPSLKLNLSIENLFDETYYLNSYSELWTMPGSPVNYKATIKYSF